MERCWTMRVACISLTASRCVSMRTELDGTGTGRTTAISDQDRERGQRAIRETIEAIARFNRYRQ